MNAGISSGARFELSPENRNLLGRDWQCRIVLNDPQSSRVHAEVFKDEDGWWIQDNKSRNGTYVNGQAIDNARLVDGTEIRIGASMLTFQSHLTKSSKPAEQEPQHEEQVTGGTIVVDQSLSLIHI